MFQALAQKRFLGLLQSVNPATEMMDRPENCFGYGTLSANSS
jgi:hypothetical protein